MNTLSRGALRTVSHSKAKTIGEDTAVTTLNTSDSLAGHQTGAGATPPTRSTSTSGIRRLRRQRSSVWREQVRGRLADLRVELDAVPSSLQAAARLEDAKNRINEATVIVNRKPSVLGLWTGVDIEATWMRIHAIEVALIRLATPEIVRGKLARIIDDGSHLLGKDHPRVRILRTYEKRPHWKDEDRECLAQSVRAVFEEADRENVRLRSFRNVLLGATFALTLLAIAFAVFGVLLPNAIGLSDDSAVSASAGRSCLPAASRTDVLVVELLGLISASLVGAIAIHRIHGTSTAYGVPMASLLLKLPTGALTALAGIVMMRAGFGGSLAVASDTHMTAYALLFGASQQGFTGLVDRQAYHVLSNVSSKDNT